ncbi:MAG: helix-turn-helix domain-containing protein [Chloroflexi bacterium]|nr:helix-turn-helix domain-containing protein [Chloroflexota bacterium]
MATRERPADRGAAKGFRLLRAIGAELRAARIDRGLSARDVAAALGCSHTTVLRTEKAFVRGTGLVFLGRHAAVVGLDLSARLYPGGPPIRDESHVALLERFRARLHPSLRRATEVPLALPGDQRAWDVQIGGVAWRYGVEAETGPQDGQALKRRLELKRRDSEVDGVILLLRESRRCREFLDAVRPMFLADFPVSARILLERLGAGRDPGGSGILLL